MSAPELGTVRKEIHVRHRGPVGWLNLRLLFDIGFLASISAAASTRTTRREVLAALDRTRPVPPVFDYSKETEGDFWLDYVADLGDGFDATHSVAWLIGRDFLGIGQPKERVAQPIPKDQFQECGPDDFTGLQVLPAGKVLILGGDLVYPFATPTAYEERTIGPYQAARAWQLDEKGKPDGRRLFSIPGNHDWYEGLGAFVRRFCQPGRWMGCWQVQQRRSYFAIHLPHQVWIWGVDLATEDDFDAPQLDYFDACAKKLKDGDTVILCVPKPAWVDREFWAGKTADESKSWQSWNKIDKISKLIAQRGKNGEGPRVSVILSGDLHHYSRYLAPGKDGDDTHLVTCGGGGAYLQGTAGLPPAVTIDGASAAMQQAVYPGQNTSQRLRKRVFKLPLRHWDFSTVLGAVMLTLVWYLNTAGPRPILSRGFGGFWSGLCATLLSSPLPLLVLAAVFYGFFSFARSGGEERRGRAALAALVHMLAQLGLAIGIVSLLFASGLPWLVAVPLALALGWAGAGLLFATYLIAANRALGLHGMEIYSAQSIEDWKCFLRIRVHPRGVTLYPIGLDKVCHGWTALGAKNTGAAPRPQAGWLQKLRAMLGGAARRFTGREDVFDDDPRLTHLYAPQVPLAPHLIETPIDIPRKGILT